LRIETGFKRQPDLHPGGRTQSTMPATVPSDGAAAKAAAKAVLVDTIQKLLVEEAVAGDNELQVRRKLLARRDPIACLRQLQRLNRSLIAESRRQLENHVRLAATLRIQMLFRGKTAAD
jgi:hypothetical protein